MVCAYRAQTFPACVCAVFFLLLAAWPTFAADPVYPPLTARIHDGANLLSSEARQRIEAKLQAHEAKTTDQVVVTSVPSLQDITIEDFANGLFRFWKLGDKARNNGILLLVAPTERKVRIEVGYGLEGALTDALSKVIITTAIAPKFKTGDFTGGIEGGVDAILSILTGDAEEWQRRAVIRNDESSGVDAVVVIIVMIFVAILLVSFLRGGSRQGARQHRTRNGRWITLPPTGSGWSGGSSGWGGGGGSGGFSGGGGSSGGGGASGDW